MQAYVVQDAPHPILPAALEEPLDAALDEPLDAEDGHAWGAAEGDLVHAAQQAATAASAEVLLCTSNKAHSFSTSSTVCIAVPVSWSSPTTSKDLWCHSGCAWRDDIRSAALLLMLC